jgi:hypothetical protein
MAGKNFYGIVRSPHKAVKSIVHGLINQQKAISKLQICRAMNARDLTYCKYAMRCYANSRKRAMYGLIHYADCHYSFMQIRYAIKKLVAEGKIWVKKQRWPDHWQPRGWDFMWICRPVQGVQ